MRRSIWRSPPDRATSELKILTNATVTIPLLAAQGDGRGFSGNVLQAALRSLQTHPDPRLQALVDSRISALGSQPVRGNVNLYVSSEARFNIANRDLALQVESGMPWSGKTTILATASEPVRAVVKLRVPGWALNRVAPGSLYSYASSLRGSMNLSINSRSVTAAADAHGYVSLDREWRSGDRIELELHSRSGRSAPTIV